MPAPVISPWSWTNNASAPPAVTATPHYHRHRGLGGGRKLVYVGMLAMMLSGCPRRQEIKLEPRMYIGCIQKWDYSKTVCEPTKNPDWYVCKVVLVKAECVKVKE